MSSFFDFHGQMLLVYVFFASVLLAQFGTTISGTVVDSTGGRIAGATVVHLAYHMTRHVQTFGTRDNLLDRQHYLYYLNLGRAVYGVSFEVLRSGESVICP
jgi:hypothetical protein